MLSSQPESSRLVEDEVLSPEPGRVKEDVRQPSPSWRGASKSHLSHSRRLRVRPRRSPFGCDHNLRGSAPWPSPAPLRATQNFAHTAAAARPLFAASRAPLSAAGSCSAAAAALLRAPDFSPAASNSHPGASLATAGVRRGSCGGQAVQAQRS